MPQKKDKAGNTRISIVLPEQDLKDYWQFIGMSQAAWNSLKPTQQAELAWRDMIEKQRLASSASDDLKSALDD